MRGFHRGIYEHLWSEHRFAAIAVSQRRYHAAASKLGHIPHVLALLKILARIAEEPQKERRQALLHAYQATRGKRDRRWARATIEDLLVQPEEGAARIFRAALEDANDAVCSSRLFYPGTAPFKRWEHGDPPGLWVLFGPLQMHLGTDVILTRLSGVATASGVDLPTLLTDLSHGLSAPRWAALPQAIRRICATHVLVAQAGNTLWLHPQAMRCLFPHFGPPPVEREAGLSFKSADRICRQTDRKATEGDIFPDRAKDYERSAGVLLESRWDTFPNEVGTLPEWKIFHDWWISGAHPEPVLDDEKAIITGFAFLVEQFAQRQLLEHGSL